MSDRVLKTCEVCSQEDDHPRHEIYGAGGHHFDCGAESLDCGLCMKSEARTGGKRGPDLIAELDRLNNQKEN